MKLLTYISFLNVVVYGFSSISQTTLLPIHQNRISSDSSSVIQLHRNVMFSVPFHRRPGSSSIDNNNIRTITTTKLLSVRGGGGINNKNSSTELQQSSTFETGTKCPMTGIATILGSIWGTGGVLYILGKAIKRVLPIALEPFNGVGTPLTQYELAYVIFFIFLR